MSTVEEIVREIAQKMGTTAEKAWPLYVQYIHADAFAPCLVAAVLVGFVLIIAIACWITAWRMKDWDADARAGLTFGPAVALAFTLVIAGITVSDNLATVLAPEGAAIAKIVGRVTK